MVPQVPWDQLPHALAESASVCDVAPEHAGGVWKIKLEEGDPVATGTSSHGTQSQHRGRGPCVSQVLRGGASRGLRRDQTT